MTDDASEDDVLDHVFDQAWVPELREDGLYLVAANDRTPIAKLCRPDHGRDLFVAGYIMGLQGKQLQSRDPVPQIADVRPTSSVCATTIAAEDYVRAKVRAMCSEMSPADLRVAIEVHRLGCYQADCPVLAAMVSVEVEQGERSP